MTYPRISGVNYESVVDGEGVRAVFFLSGCSHHCPGCHNQKDQDPSSGIEISGEDLDIFAGEIEKRPYIAGITLSGGDPLYNPMLTLSFMLGLSRRLVDKGLKSTAKNIWLYTGYTWEQIVPGWRSDLSDNDIIVRTILNKCSVVVDGRFVKELADKRLSFRGSSNQRIIDVQRSLYTGDVVTLDY